MDTRAPYFEYRNGWLYSEQVDLNTIADTFGTPCYIYSQACILDNLHTIQQAFPQAEVHYSLKANANLTLVKLIHQAGAGVDVVSGGEIYRALLAGIPPSQIVFAGVGKTADELQYALAQDIGWFNVESRQELHRLSSIAQAMGTHPRVALRVNPDVQADTHHYIATGHAASKFGIAFKDVQSILAEHANQRDKAVFHIDGIHVHIGSQLNTVERTVQAVQAVLPLFDAYPFLTSLNLGGGFPISYDGQSMPSVSAFAEHILPLLDGRLIQLMLEPGRSVIARAGILLVSVQYVKSTPQGVVVITDGGMTELIRPALYSAVHTVMSVRDQRGETTQLSHVVGPICESADVLCANVQLASALLGDRLAIFDVGAYGAVMASTYNARPRAPELLVNGDNVQVIRRREQWADLVALEQIDD